jgi:hypothetical protein
MSKKSQKGNDEYDDDYCPPYVWPMAFWMPMGRRYSELQERVLRDHQRQLGQVARKVASGEYTPQSMVAEAWRFWARVWGDWADFTRTVYGLDTTRRNRSFDPEVFSMRAVSGEESARKVFQFESARLPRGRSELTVSALKSSETPYTIPKENISFDPAVIEPDVRGEQDVLVIVTKLAVEGNKVEPGYYTGTIQAVTDQGRRVLGLLVLELPRKGG